MVYSYTAIKQYQNCPKAFLHRYVLRDVREEKSVQQTFGEVAHRALQAYINRGTEPLAGTEYCRAVIEGVDGSCTRYAEHKLAIDGTGAPVEFFAPGVWLRGVIDFLVIRKNRALIFDWKFGKRRPDLLQLRLMALLTFGNFPEVEVIHAALIWEADKASNIERFTRARLDELVTECHELTERIESSVQHDNWPLQPSGLCGWCPVDSTRCVYAKKREMPERDDF